MLARAAKKILVLIKSSSTSAKMAKSKFEYVKNFELDQSLLPNTWIVVRIDGRNFHKFAEMHNFSKPNDSRALDLMNRAAVCVMQEFNDVLMAYGQSDEYSFVLRKDAQIYNRRGYKITSYLTSLFTSSYIFYWGDYFNSRLLYPPAFDARAVLYPSDVNLRDYLSWRQADVHVNNLYNTCFWTLVQRRGLTPKEAEAELRGTVSSEKNELLFSQFNINYNNEPIMFRKGTTLLRKRLKGVSETKGRVLIVPFHEDVIQDKFWTKHELLDRNPGQDADGFEEVLPQLIKVQLAS